MLADAPPPPTVKVRAYSHLLGESGVTVFGAEGRGLFAAPTAIEGEVRRQYGVRVVGRTDAVRERFYAISVERRISHPAVLALTTAARQDVFG